MQREDRTPALRDWLGWLFAVLLALIGALSTVAWTALKERVDRLEMFGSTPLRLDVSKMNAQISDLQRQIDAANHDIEELRAQTRRLLYNEDPNAQPPSPPRFRRN